MYECKWWQLTLPKMLIRYSQTCTTIALHVPLADQCKTELFRFNKVVNMSLSTLTLFFITTQWCSWHLTAYSVTGEYCFYVYNVLIF